VSAGWVAGSVRARLLVRRCLGRAGARELASLPPHAAVERLSASSYGHDVSPEMDPAEADRGIARTALWNLRVLAGWLTPAGADLVRLMAAGFEIDNIEGRLAFLGGATEERPFDLGALSSAWRRIARARTPAELRTGLVASGWGDPGGEAASRVAIGLRVVWARRLADRSATLAPWAEAGAAIVVARERFSYERSLAAPTLREALRLLGRGWERAASLGDYVSGLPRADRWPFESVRDPEDLWRAEARWWRRVEGDALSLLLRWSAGPDAVIAAVTLLLADAWRARAALAASGWGAGARDAFDAVA
jgi:hypothetical protein